MFCKGGFRPFLQNITFHNPSWHNILTFLEVFMTGIPIKNFIAYGKRKYCRRKTHFILDRF
jgi:hypothetical protein